MALSVLTVRKGGEYPVYMRFHNSFIHSLIFSLLPHCCSCIFVILFIFPYNLAGEIVCKKCPWTLFSCKHKYVQLFLGCHHGRRATYWCVALCVFGFQSNNPSCFSFITFVLYCYLIFIYSYVFVFLLYFLLRLF